MRLLTIFHDRLWALSRSSHLWSLLLYIYSAVGALVKKLPDPTK